PLPPLLTVPPALLKRISEVDNMLGRLDGKAQALPDRRILIRSFVRREAQLSSYIENTYARYDEVAAAEQRDRGEQIDEPVRETLNAEHAINAGVQAVFERGQPVTLALIKQMHGVLLRGVRGHGTRGRFRDVQVFIGKQHEHVDRARFVPAPAHAVEELMEQFGRYLSGADDLPAVVQIALLHYQFEAIHPFEDGNGRLGRILILLGLCQHRLLSVPLLNASLHFERNRQEYYDGLLRVSTHGGWESWLTFFVEGLRVAASESAQKLSELTNLQQEYRQRLSSARNSALLLKLVDNLFIEPVVSVTDAARLMGVTYGAAKSSVSKLIDAGILAPVKRSTMPATFIAKAILKAVNAEPTSR
ncbi:MAG: Fic family protein, partial [Tepidisphaeraceae bacterium]